MKQQQLQNGYSARLSRRILLFWCFFIGIGAVGGSLCMFIDPTGKTFGMDAFFEGFKNLPFYDVYSGLFENLIFPGISLLIVNGISNLLAAVLLLKKKHIGIVLGMVFGITLMLWIIIQFVIFPLNVMSITYFIFGIAQFITGYVCLVRTTQEGYQVSRNTYFNIKNRSDTLVVYFSRVGYTKKLAYDKADELHAELYEIQPKEQTKGVSGFWWCGRYGMHRWTMPINECKKELGRYKKVVICTPVWVFSLASPVRQFCKEEKGKIKHVEYVINHFEYISWKGVAKEMDRLLGIKGENIVSVTTHMGKVKRVHPVI
ncbi:MAG: hypothetical protein Q4G58_12290 [bacterium]|nr:hypothetical protein [bacterium]